MMEPISNEEKYEKHIIVQLQEERTYVQKKTFTKWMNSFLHKEQMHVEDLFVDLEDGIKLHKLLEIISNEKIRKPSEGKTRIHKLENVNECIKFLKNLVKLENIGAADIVDGNPRLILGLLWCIILRYQIESIELDVPSQKNKTTNEEEEEEDKKSAANMTKNNSIVAKKEALLSWCQKRTEGYAHVSVKDFSHSWRDGMAFNALIHSYKPEVVDYDLLDPSRHIDNLNLAFELAQTNLAIEPLLDAEDVDTKDPDERSILTYISYFYHAITNEEANRQDSAEKEAFVLIKSMPNSNGEAVVDDANVELTEELLVEESAFVHKTDEDGDEGDGAGAGDGDGDGDDVIDAPLESSKESVLEPVVLESNHNETVTSAPPPEPEKQIFGIETNQTSNDLSENVSYLWIVVFAVGAIILSNAISKFTPWI